MKNRVCTILCLITMLGLALMLVQEHWKPFKLNPLKGFTAITEKPLLTLDNLITGKYQARMEQYISENFGFREFFIRFYNQFSYSLFRVITNNNVVEGTNRELFLRMYLEDYSGQRLFNYYSNVDEAKASAQYNVQETLRLIDTLQNHGTQFLFIFAPTKTAVYPETLPEPYRSQKSDFSLEEYYLKLFQENNIPHIDFYNYFKTIKDTVAYPLYTRTGTHWAESTLPFVADSIYRRLESLTGYRLANITVIDENITRKYSDTDRELEDNMNLLFPYPKPALPNPETSLTDTLEADRPNLLIIGDSYGNLLAFSTFAKAFNNWDFWIYNRKIYSSRKRYNWKALNHELHAWRILEDADIVLAVFTAPFYYNYMFEFPRTAQELFDKGYFNEDEAVGIVMEIIQNDSLWYAKVQNQAHQLNISVENCLESNAKYYLSHLKDTPAN